MAQRPLSPHLFVYRFAYTMAMSIFHRISGVAMSFGLFLLVGFVAALASGPDAYACFAGLAGSWPVHILLGLLVVAFLFHLANGVRHLFWDAGIGIERAAARRSWKIVIAFVVVASAVLYYLLFRGARP